MAEKNLRSLKFPGSDDIYKIAQPDYAQTDSTQPDFIKNKIVGDVVEYSETMTFPLDAPYFEINGAKVYQCLITKDMMSSGGSYTLYSSSEVLFEGTRDAIDDEMIVDDNFTVIICRYLVLYIVGVDNYELEGIVFPKAGNYIAIKAGDSGTFTFNCGNIPLISTKKLDKKYFDVAWDNVKDKPFGIDWDNPTVLMENQDVTFVREDNGDTPMFNFAIKLDCFYRVVVNGNVYDYYPFVFAMGNSSIIVLSDKDLANSPIAFLNLELYGKTMVENLTEGETYNISVYEYNAKQKLENMFFDSGITTYIVNPYDADIKYLYKKLRMDIVNGEMISEKVSNSELAVAVGKGTIVIKDGMGTYIMQPIYIDFGIEDGVDHATVYCMKKDGTIVQFYTAEYTP